MPRIAPDQIEVGNGPQNSLTKYGPGPEWDLLACRITDNGTTISAPGRAVNIGDVALVNNGTGAAFDDVDGIVAIAANGKNPNTFAKLDMQASAGDGIAQAVLSSKMAGITAGLNLNAEALETTLGFSPVGEGTLNLNADNINLNSSVAVKKNGLNLGVVYSDSAVNQTDGMAVTGMTVDGASGAVGLFRISYYLVITTPGTSGTVKLVLGWTDPGAVRAFDSEILTFGTLAAPTSGSVIIRSTGASIDYSTVIDLLVGDPEYALYITLERLQ